MFMFMIFMIMLNDVYDDDNMMFTMLMMKINDFYVYDVYDYGK